MRVRLLPLLIFGGGLMLTVKVGSLWQGVSDFVERSGSVVDTELVVEQSTASAQEEEAPTIGANPDEPSAPVDGDTIPEDMTPAPTTDIDDPLAGGDLSSMSPGEIRLLHDLVDRRRKLKRREQNLKEREALIRSAEQQLVAKQERLSAIKVEIEELLQFYQKEQQEEARKLVNIYSNMKPRSAAAIFDDMDMNTLLSVLRGMKERKIAPIMAEMNPEKARLVTRELAEVRELPELPQ